jgi:hypothetical protein
MKAFLAIKYNLLGETILFNFYDNIYNFGIQLWNSYAIMTRESVKYSEENYAFNFKTETIFSVLYRALLSL